MILLLEIIENWLGANSFSNMEVNEKIQAETQQVHSSSISVLRQTFVVVNKK